MKRFIFIFIAIIIVGIAVVTIHESTKTESVVQESEEESIDTVSSNRDDGSDRLAYWFPRHDSLNHGLVCVAEELWRLDSAAARSNNIGRKNWFERCKKRLSACFDSIHSESNLPEIEKADSMLTEIAAFFEQDADYSTMGMIVNVDLQTDFLIYRIAAEGSRIMKYEPTFSDELKAWDELQEAMNTFCLGVVNWDWFGGSGAGPSCLAEKYNILQCRLEDLKRVHKQYRREFPMRLYSRVDFEKDIDVHIKKAKTDFRKSIEKVANSVNKDESAKEYLSEDRLVAYDNLYNIIQAAQEPLKKALDNWLKVRNRFPIDEGNIQRAAKNKYNENTAITIDSLSECIRNSIIDM